MMELGEKASAQEVMNAKLSELQKASKDEIDALKGQLNALRAASESKVCHVWSLILSIDADCVC